MKWKKRKSNCHIEKISINLISLETCVVVVVFSWSCAFYCTLEIDFEIHSNQKRKRQSNDHTQSSTIVTDDERYDHMTPGIESG